MSLCSSRQPGKGPSQWLPAIRAMFGFVAAPMAKLAWDSVPGVVRIVVRGLVLGLILAAPRAVYAAVLEDVEFASLPGNQVEIDLVFSGAVPTPTDFATENPARIAIDFPGVNSGLDKKQMPIGLGVAHSLVAIEASDRTRVVINLNDSVPYEVTTRGNRVTIALNPERSAPVPRQAPQPGARGVRCRRAEPAPRRARPREVR